MKWIYHIKDILNPFGSITQRWTRKPTAMWLAPVTVSTSHILQTFPKLLQQKFLMKLSRFLTTDILFFRRPQKTMASACPWRPFRPCLTLTLLARLWAYTQSNCLTITITSFSMVASASLSQTWTISFQLKILKNGKGIDIVLIRLMDCIAWPQTNFKRKVFFNCTQHK